MTKSKKKSPPDLAAFVQRSMEVEAEVRARLNGKLMHPPRDPGAAFDQLVGMIQAGALEMARAVFLEDADTRARWNLMRGRLTEEEHARAEGRAGGTAAAAGNKLADGSNLTPTQKRRAEEYHRLLPLKGAKTLAAMARKEDVHPNAIRQSLKAAGIDVGQESASSPASGDPAL
jgi:hypothetical protein